MSDLPVWTSLNPDEQRFEIFGAFGQFREYTHLQA
jgi:hypothetical protein